MKLKKKKKITKQNEGFGVWLKARGLRHVSTLTREVLKHAETMLTW